MRKTMFCFFSNPVLFAVLFVATLVGNWKGAFNLTLRAVNDCFNWDGRGYRGNGEYTDAFRQLAEKHLDCEERLYYCANSKKGILTPSERSTHLALSWAMSPTPVQFGSADVLEDADAIIVSRYLDADFPGYWLAAENDSAVLWRRDNTSCMKIPQGKVIASAAPFRELSGVLAASCLILALTWRLQPRECRMCGRITVQNACVFAFFVLAAMLALSHTFMAPTGLGVHGGKAKLFFMARGIPDGFFTDSVYSSYQPAYPPGLTLLTLLAYGISGCCGEWLVQLIPVFAAAVSMWLVGRTGSGSQLALLWIAATFFAEQTLQMATMYYAEPFVAMFFLLGWMRLRENRRDFAGWILLGMAGLFKIEGLILIVSTWLALGIGFAISGNVVFPGGKIRMFFDWMARLAIATAMPMSWYFACRLAGAAYYDYASLWDIDFSRFVDALAHLLKISFLEPWRYGFAYPIASMVAVVTIACCWRSARRGSGSSISFAAFASLLSMVLFALVYSLSRAPDFQWHLWSSAARLLWAPSLIVLAEIVANGSQNIVGCPVSAIVRACRNRPIANTE